jgi:hypothetical protein
MSDHKRPQTHIRWVCEQCEYDTARPRPESPTELMSEAESDTCPQCGDSTHYFPFPLIHTKIQMDLHDGSLNGFERATRSGETIEDALNGHEVGTELAERDGFTAPADRASRCMCDWCNTSIEAGESVTAYAYRHPDHEDPDGWALHELYCERCDVAKLLLGGEVTDDVLVHAHISEWGDMLTIEDTAVIDRQRMGESLYFAPEE